MGNRKMYPPCGVKRCECKEFLQPDVRAVEHARTVITRWLRNDLGPGVDGDYLSNVAEGRFHDMQLDKPWRGDETQS